MQDEIITGDCLSVLEGLEENTVHAIVTDPPYGLAFMGRDWDDFEPKEYQEWCESWARKAKRVLKPGGHLLAFSGNRTHHRLFTGVEDAGFEVRDTITWHYGSGFPKSLDVSKAIDKAVGARREKIRNPLADKQTGQSDTAALNDKSANEYIEPAPATSEAEAWDGWKTGLKPATEYVVVARAPLSEGTVAENVRTYGTGALNIDGCRVDTDGEDLSYGPESGGTSNCQNSPKSGAMMEQHDEGRYPSNVVFDETEAERLDSKNDKTVSSGGVPSGDEKDERVGGFQPNIQESTGGLGDSGGVSRYFYTSKASKSERTLDGKIENAHPTVKPQDLMEWLVKLVTRENQRVLDPFCGSGTTLKACKDLNRRFVGIEQNPEWADVARVRVGLTPNDPSVVRSDESQHGLEAFQ